MTNLRLAEVCKSNNECSKIDLCFGIICFIFPLVRRMFGYRDHTLLLDTLGIMLSVMFFWLSYRCTVSWHRHDAVLRWRFKKMMGVYPPNSSDYRLYELRESLQRTIFKTMRQLDRKLGRNKHAALFEHFGFWTSTDLRDTYNARMAQIPDCPI